MFMLILTFILVCHILACLWFFVAKVEDFPPDSWVTINDYNDASNFDLYIVSFYYTITTLTTVEYGDITPGNSTEKIVSCILMINGVVFYSNIIGLLTSIMTELDKRNSKISSKFGVLDEISKEFKLN